MSGFEMFCERCGKRYGSGEATAAGALPLTKRLLTAVGLSTSAPQPPADEPFLRFCLACRGYSCPSCWNEEAGFCQTCVPMPEPIVEHVHLPEFEAPPSMTFTPIELTASALAFGQTELPQIADMPPVETAAEAAVPWAADTAIPWAPESQVPWATKTPAVPWSTDPTMAAPDVDSAALSFYPSAPEVALPESTELDAAQFETAEAEAAEPVSAEAVAEDEQGVEPVAFEDDVADQQADAPAGEAVAPAMSFGEPVAAAPFIAFAALAESDAAEDEFVAEMAPEVEPVEVEAVAYEAETEAEVEAVEVEAVEVEAVEVEAVDVDVFGVEEVVELEAVEAEAGEAEAVADVIDAVAAEAEATEDELVAAEAVEAEADADADAIPSLAMGERPLELVAADVEEYVEPEPDVTWDWEEIPVDDPVAAAAAAATTEEEPAAVAAADGLVEVPPTEPASSEPEAVVPPPIFRPLPPLGPIVPPPPPVPSMPVPRMEFDLPDAPPAYVIAPVQPSQARVLPTGLFDGPTPQIRPCAQCDLPVSAKARFCRRCGSAQEPLSPS